MISYLLQAISSILFGPVSASIIIISRFRNDSLPGLYSRILEATIDVADTILKTNLFVSFAVAIASIDRYRKIPPLVERWFLNSIVLFQTLVTACFYISSLAYGDSFHLKYIHYQVSITALFLLGFLIRALPSSSTHILESVMAQCTIQRNYPWPVYRTIVRFNLVFSGSVFAVLIVGVVAFTIFKSPIQAVCGKLWKYFANWIRRYSHITSRSSFLRIGLLLATAFWMTIIIYLMVRVERIRQQLQKASGSLTQDSEWGFGQVIAVISWAPVLHEIFVKAFGLFIQPSMMFKGS